MAQRENLDVLVPISHRQQPSGGKGDEVGRHPMWEMVHE
jgi:hypothetical protein